MGLATCRDFILDSTLELVHKHCTMSFLIVECHASRSNYTAIVSADICFTEGSIVTDMGINTPIAYWAREPNFDGVVAN